MGKRVTVERLGEAVRAAYVEGYVQGSLHPNNARVLDKANDLAEKFWRVVEYRLPAARPHPEGGDRQ